MHDWLPVVSILASIPVGLLTAWVTVKLALRRFQSEKWFERRLEAYTRIIDALHHMKQVSERQLRAEELGIEIPSDAEKQLIELYQSSLADLRRITDMGALVFSPEAIVVLEQLNSDLEASTRESSWWEHLDAEAAAVNKCLRDIRQIAKNDLYP